jgi:Uma2 family endonuclease
MQLAHQVRWTEEEYLLMEDHSEIKHEFLDGQVYAMAGAQGPHNVIATNALAMLHSLVRGGPCRAFNSDQRVYVPRPKKLYTYPDGGVACGKWQYHPKAADKMVLLNPSLLYEVLSPGTEKYDRGTKLMLYRQVETLQDVLLIDPDRRLVEHHHRGPRGWKSTTRHRGALSVLGGIIQVGELFEGLEGLA